jgi:opacity protein-like surface antigen
MKRNLFALIAAVLALPAIASAQTTRYDDPRYDDYGTSVNKTPATIGSSVGLMGDIGIQDYNRNVSDELNVGVGYGAKIDITPQRNIGLELSYNGAVNGISDRFSTNGNIVTNQVGGNLKINMIPPNRAWAVRPFIFGGASYYRIDTNNFTPGISDNNAFAIPAGLGLETDIGRRFLLGARYTYNFLFNESDGFAGRQADSWIVGLNIGARLGSL